MYGEGREYPKTVILDTEVESYYQFKHGSVCKKRFKNNGWDETYALNGDRWVYDVSLERMFEDLCEYDNLRCEISGVAKQKR